MNKNRVEDEMVYIATISGGKDSVTMCDLLLKNGHPVDHIIFCDTLSELPVMYEYIKKVNSYFMSRYGKEIEIVLPNKTPEQLIFSKIGDKSAKRYGSIKGIPNPMMGFCEWRRDSKIVPMDKYIKEKGIKKYKKYIGFTMDEAGRKSDDGISLYPLIDIFRFSEKMCQEYLVNQEMENPLYKHFTRTGCGWCMAQPDKAWHMVWKHFPETWEWMKWIEARLLWYINQGHDVISPHWFMDNKTCADKEVEFINADKQGRLFDFSDEPLKDCFCKI